MNKSLITFAFFCVSICLNAQSVGSIKGSFAVSETGASIYALPISVPQGINGLQPDITLAYNSQAGNGIAGVGFNIFGISAISRVPKTIYHDGCASGIKYSANDAFSMMVCE